ncbi:MAG: hypothetical protein ACUVV6_09015 [Thermoplasmatota archaeon]
MGARTLQEAYRACGEDLSDRGAFLRYYVAREAGASLELTERMLMDQRPIKALLAGQSGSGKTVELLRVAHDTSPALAPVYVRLGVSPEDFSPGETLLAMARGLCQGLVSEGLQLSEKPARALTGWLREVIGGPIEDRSDLQGVVEMLGRALERTRKREHRAEAAAAVEGRANELAHLLTEATVDVRGRSGREPLLILDGLERVGAEAYGLLLGPGLLELGVKCISTIPFSALHSPELRRLRRAYDAISVQPLNEMTPGSLALREGSVADLRDILEKRTGEELLELPAEDALLLNSGGSPGELIRFTAASCVRASMLGKSRIDASVVERVLDDFRQEMKRLLSPEEWQVALRIHREGSAPPDPVLNSLLELGAVLEHFGGREPFQVHPVLTPLLKEKGAV